MLRLAEALDHFKPGLGDVAMVLAFTGLRWEEAVAVPAENVDLDGQCMTIDRTASESGGRRDVREDMKTRAAVRLVMIPDAVRATDQRRPRRLPRICDVAQVPRADPRLHGGAQGRRDHLHLPRAAPRSAPPCSSRPGRATCRSRTRWATARSRRPRTSTAPVRPGPRLHPESDQPGRQPTARPRGHRRGRGLTVSSETKTPGDWAPGGLSCTAGPTSCRATCRALSSVSPGIEPLTSNKPGGRYWYRTSGLYRVKVALSH